VCESDAILHITGVCQLEGLTCACWCSTVFTTWRRTICPLCVNRSTRTPAVGTCVQLRVRGATLPFQRRAQPATVLAASPSLDRPLITRELKTKLFSRAWLAGDCLKLLERLNIDIISSIISCSQSHARA